MALSAAYKGKVFGIIGDEDTCVGFLLGGVGEINKNRHPNFMVVDKRKNRPWLFPWVIVHKFPDTTSGEIEDCFKRFVKRDDIAIILINQTVAEQIRHVIDAHTSATPAVLEIPSKDNPYDPTKDSILRRAKVWILLLVEIQKLSKSIFNCRVCLVLMIWWLEQVAVNQRKTYLIYRINQENTKLFKKNS